MRIKSL